MAQNTTVFEPLQHLVQGAIQGHQIHQMMLHASLQQEAAQRQAYQQDRENQIENIGVQQKLLSSADPVDSAGMVDGTFEGVDGLVGKFSKDQTYSTKADRSRTVEFNGKQYQLHTPQQQLRDQISAEKQKKKAETAAELEKAQMLEDVKTTGAVSQHQGMLDKFGVDLPNPNAPGQKLRVLPSEVSGVSTGLAKETPKPKTIHNSQITTNDKGKQVQVLTWSDGTVEEKPLTALGKSKAVDEAAANFEPQTDAKGNPVISSTAKMIANYDLPAPSARSLTDKAGRGQKLLAEVMAANPDYSAAMYPARAAMKKDFTSGKAADNIRSINTLIGHLDQLKDASDKLPAHSIPLGNRFQNAVASQFGSPAVKSYNTVKDVAVNELRKAVGAGVSESEIQRIMENFDPNGSPEQRTSAINQAITLAGSRIDALGTQWDQGMGGSMHRPTPLVSTKSKKILTKLGRNDVAALDGDASDKPADKAPAAIDLTKFEGK